MLVLSRKINEDIIIRVPGHDDIVVRLLDIKDNYKVRLGIDAAREIQIIRAELEHGKVKWNPELKGKLQRDVD